MTALDLPLHPSLRHPITGAPIRALALRPRHEWPKTEKAALDTARYLWPMMGGAPDPTPEEQAAAEKQAAEDKAAADKKAAEDAAAEKARAAGVPANYATDPQGNSLGYPKETAVAEMKQDEQTAYWRHQSRRHEQRATEWQDAAGGKTPSEVKTEREELTKLRQAGMTDAEKKIDEAKESGRAEVRQEMAPKMARLAFDTALAHVPDERRSTLIENLDLSKVITDSGDIDTDKVKTIAASLAEPAKGGPTSRTPNYGGGPRPTPTSSGVAAGAELHASRKKPAATPSA